jgi:hypothetical protein
MNQGAVPRRGYSLSLHVVGLYIETCVLEACASCRGTVWRAEVVGI